MRSRIFLFGLVALVLAGASNARALPPMVIEYGGLTLGNSVQFVSTPAGRQIIALHIHRPSVIVINNDQVRIDYAPIAILFDGKEVESIPINEERWRVSGLVPGMRLILDGIAIAPAAGSAVCRVVSLGDGTHALNVSGSRVHVSVSFVRAPTDFSVIAPPSSNNLRTIRVSTKPDPNCPQSASTAPAPFFKVPHAAQTTFESAGMRTGRYILHFQYKNPSRSVTVRVTGLRSNVISNSYQLAPSRRFVSSDLPMTLYPSGTRVTFFAASRTSKLLELRDVRFEPILLDNALIREINYTPAYSKLGLVSAAGGFDMLIGTPRTMASLLASKSAVGTEPTVLFNQARNKSLIDAVARLASRVVVSVEGGDNISSGSGRFYVPRTGLYQVSVLGGRPVRGLLHVMPSRSALFTLKPWSISIDGRRFSVKAASPQSILLSNGSFETNDDLFAYNRLRRFGACGYAKTMTSDASELHVVGQLGLPNYRLQTRLDVTPHQVFLSSGWHSFSLAAYSSSGTCSFTALDLVRGHRFGAFGSVAVSADSHQDTMTYSKPDGPSGGLYFFLGALPAGRYQLSLRQLTVAGNPTRIAVYADGPREYLTTAFAPKRRSAKMHIAFDVPRNAGTLTLYFYLDSLYSQRSSTGRISLTGPELGAAPPMILVRNTQKKTEIASVGVTGRPPSMRVGRPLYWDTFFKRFDESTFSPQRFFVPYSGSYTVVPIEGAFAEGLVRTNFSTGAATFVQEGWLVSIDHHPVSLAGRPSEIRFKVPKLAFTVNGARVVYIDVTRRVGCGFARGVQSDVGPAVTGEPPNYLISMPIDAHPSEFELNAGWHDFRIERARRTAFCQFSPPHLLDSGLYTSFGGLRAAADNIANAILYGKSGKQNAGIAFQVGDLPGGSYALSVSQTTMKGPPAKIAVYAEQSRRYLAVAVGFPDRRKHTLRLPFELPPSGESVLLYFYLDGGSTQSSTSSIHLDGPAQNGPTPEFALVGARGSAQAEAVKIPPVVLRLNQSWDDRWAITDRRAIHSLADAYANVWLLDDAAAGNVVVSYTLAKQLRWSVAISLAAYGFVIAALVTIRPWRNRSRGSDH